MNWSQKRRSAVELKKTKAQATCGWALTAMR
jgi:hypothetical protein